MTYKTREIEEIYEVRKILEINMKRIVCEHVDNKMIKELKKINEKLFQLFKEGKKCLKD